MSRSAAFAATPACSECVLRSAASASRAPLRSARPRARGFVDAAAEPIDYLEEAVARIEKAASLIRIAELCETVGVSKRHLSRTFADVVGVGPKYFAKVIQLNAALGALLGGDEGEISRVAHALGYTDQAHFVHLMQELLRMPPTAFLESDDDVLTTFVAKSQVDRTT